MKFSFRLRWSRIEFHKKEWSICRRPGVLKITGYREGALKQNASVNVTFNSSLNGFLRLERVNIQYDPEGFGNNISIRFPAGMDD